MDLVWRVLGGLKYEHHSIDIYQKEYEVPALGYGGVVRNFLDIFVNSFNELSRY